MQWPSALGQHTTLNSFNSVYCPWEIQLIGIQYNNEQYINSLLKAIGEWTDKKNNIYEYLHNVYFTQNIIWVHSSWLHYKDNSLKIMRVFVLSIDILIFIGYKH